MRDNCLDELIAACVQLVSSLHSSNPELAASVLEAVARYVNWIDIRLVANDRYSNIQSTLLQNITSFGASYDILSCGSHNRDYCKQMHTVKASLNCRVHFFLVASHTSECQSY